MGLVKGKDVVLSVLQGGVNTVIGCIRSVSITTTTDTLETTTRGTGQYKTYTGTQQGFTITCEGLVSLADRFSGPNLVALQQSRATNLYQLQFTDGANFATYQGRMLITNTTQSGETQGLVSFNCDLIGSGELSYTFTPIVTSSNIFTFNNYAATGDTFAVPVLVGANVLGVWREGIGHELTQNVTPTFDEYKFDSGSGTVTFGTALVGEWFFVLYTI